MNTKSKTTNATFKVGISNDANYSQYIVIQGEPKNRKVHKTVKVSDRCLVDIDKNGLPIGIEILESNQQ